MSTIKCLKYCHIRLGLLLLRPDQRKNFSLIWDLAFWGGNWRVWCDLLLKLEKSISVYCFTGLLLPNKLPAMFSGVIKISWSSRFDYNLTENYSHIVSLCFSLEWKTFTMFGDNLIFTRGNFIVSIIITCRKLWICSDVNFHIWAAIKVVLV